MRATKSNISKISSAWFHTSAGRLVVALCLLVGGCSSARDLSVFENGGSLVAGTAKITVVPGAQVMLEPRGYTWTCYFFGGLLLLYGVFWTVAILVTVTEAKSFREAVVHVASALIPGSIGVLGFYIAMVWHITVFDLEHRTRIVRTEYALGVFATQVAIPLDGHHVAVRYRGHQEYPEHELGLIAPDGRFKRLVYGLSKDDRAAATRLRDAFAAAVALPVDKKVIGARRYY